MLTPNQEKFCLNIEIKKMTQRQAYIDAYPNAVNWKPETVDEAACRLVNKNCKVNARLKELREEEKEKIQQEAKWTRDTAFKKLNWLLEKAEKEIEASVEITSPCVSAFINSVKELNTIYAVTEEKQGQGVLEDILAAVRNVNND